MAWSATTITSVNLINDVIPKLKTVEFILQGKLQQAIDHGPSAENRTKYQLLQQEFELELLMIQMNLEHLLHRYTQDLQPTAGRLDNKILDLDDNERVAITAVYQLYERVCALTTKL